MSRDGIFPRDQVVHLLDDLLSAASFCGSVYELAGACANNELVAAVLAKGAADRQAMIDELKEAMRTLDSEPNERNPAGLCLTGADDLELITWCTCADDILDEAIRVATPLPIHLQTTLSSRRTSLLTSRECLRAWDQILRRETPPCALPKESRRADVLLCIPDHDRAATMHAQLARLEIDAAVTSGLGEGLGRLCLGEQALLVVDAALAKELDTALSGKDLASVRSRVIVLEEGDVRPQLETIALRVQAKARAGHVLVVEDDVELRSMLARALTQRGFVVEEACDGVEALKKCDRLMRWSGDANAPESHHNEVVVLDLMMPRLSGVGFLRELGMRAARPPPVVIYSAYVEPVETGYPNVTAVLRKTAGLEDVMTAITRSLEQRT